MLDKPIQFVPKPMKTFQDAYFLLIRAQEVFIFLKKHHTSLPLTTNIVELKKNIEKCLAKQLLIWTCTELKLIIEKFQTSRAASNMDLNKISLEVDAAFAKYHSILDAAESDFLWLSARNSKSEADSLFNNLYQKIDNPIIVASLRDDYKTQMKVLYNQELYNVNFFLNQKVLSSQLTPAFQILCSKLESGLIDFAHQNDPDKDLGIIYLLKSHYLFKEIFNNEIASTHAAFTDAELNSICTTVDEYEETLEGKTVSTDLRFLLKLLETFRPTEKFSLFSLLNLLNENENPCKFCVLLHDYVESLKTIKAMQVYSYTIFSYIELIQVIDYGIIKAKAEQSENRLTFFNQCKVAFDLLMRQPTRLPLPFKEMVSSLSKLPNSSLDGSNEALNLIELCNSYFREKAKELNNKQRMREDLQKLRDRLEPNVSYLCMNEEKFKRSQPFSDQLFSLFKKAKRSEFINKDRKVHIQSAISDTIRFFEDLIRGQDENLKKIVDFFSVVFVKHHLTEAIKSSEPEEALNILKQISRIYLEEYRNLKKSEQITFQQNVLLR